MLLSSACALAAAGCDSATAPSAPAVAVAYGPPAASESPVVVEPRRFAVSARGPVIFSCGLLSGGADVGLRDSDLTLTLRAKPMPGSCPIVATHYTFDTIVTGVDAGIYRVTIVARSLTDQAPDMVVKRRLITVSGGSN